MMCTAADFPPYDITSGQRVAGEGAADRARVPAPAAESEHGRRRPGHLEELISAEVRTRRLDRSWYRRRRAISVATARTFEGAVDRSEAWQRLIDENDRELRTLLRVLRKARR